jgi:hypothetical protein
VSAEKPSLEIMNLLSKNKDRQISSHAGSRRKTTTQSQSGGTFTNNVFVGSALLPGYSTDEIPSSQPTESGPDELLDLFFSWLTDRPEWRGLGADLRHIREQLESDGYDTHVIRSISASEWKELGLKGGQRLKMLQSINIWRSSRKQ